MAFVNKSGGDQGEESTDVAAGAPPRWSVDFDPNDPEQVKVHYDLHGWSLEQRSELAETLAEHELPHAWDGDELIVPEEVEGPVDELFEQLEAELGPFPVGLAGDEPATEFGLDEWPRADIDSLEQSLIEAEIPHRWSGSTLYVATDAEHVVDDLLDAIEAGEVASLDEASEAPDGALHTLFNSSDRLRRDPTHTSSREALLALVPQLDPAAPPFGVAAGSWVTMVAAATSLVDSYAAGSETDEMQAKAEALHGVCRPWV